MPPAQFRIRRLEGYEAIEIPARKSSGALFLLVVWIAAWTLLGAVVSWGWPSPRVVWVLFWLILKAVFGWLFGCVALAWMLGGVERIAVVGQDLMIRYAILGLPLATRTFRGRDIRFLAATSMPQAGCLADPIPPFLSSSRSGGFKFFYQQRTVQAGYDLDAAAAQRVVDWLLARLPVEASSPREGM